VFGTNIFLRNQRKIERISEIIIVQILIVVVVKIGEIYDVVVVVRILVDF
jgi:hypothetical protein